MRRRTAPSIAPRSSFRSAQPLVLLAELLPLRVVRRVHDTVRRGAEVLVVVGPVRVYGRVDRRLIGVVDRARRQPLDTEDAGVVRVRGVLVVRYRADVAHAVQRGGVEAQVREQRRVVEPVEHHSGDLVEVGGVRPGLGARQRGDDQQLVRGQAESGRLGDQVLLVEDRHLVVDHLLQQRRGRLEVGQDVRLGRDEALDVGVRELRAGLAGVPGRQVDVAAADGGAHVRVLPAGLGLQRGEDLGGTLAAIGDQLRLAVLVLRVQQVGDRARGADALGQKVGAGLYVPALRVGVAGVGEGPLALDDARVEQDAADRAAAGAGRDRDVDLRAGARGRDVVRRRAVLALIPLHALVATVAEAAGDHREGDEDGEAVAALLLLLAAAARAGLFPVLVVDQAEAAVVRRLLLGHGVGGFAATAAIAERRSFGAVSGLAGVTRGTARGPRRAGEFVIVLVLRVVVGRVRSRTTAARVRVLDPHLRLRARRAASRDATAGRRIAAAWRLGASLVAATGGRVFATAAARVTVDGLVLATRVTVAGRARVAAGR